MEPFIAAHRSVTCRSKRQGRFFGFRPALYYISFNSSSFNNRHGRLHWDCGICIQWATKNKTDLIFKIHRPRNLLGNGRFFVKCSLEEILIFDIFCRSQICGILALILECILWILWQIRDDLIAVLKMDKKKILQTKLKIFQSMSASIFHSGLF